MITASSVSAQSEFSESFSTGGVHLGQRFSALKTRDDIDIKESSKENSYYVDSVFVDLKDGIVIGIDFIGPLYRGSEVILQPGDSKAQVLTEFQDLKFSQEGDFECVEFPENVKLLIKFDENEKFVNGYIKML